MKKLLIFILLFTFSYPSEATLITNAVRESKNFIGREEYIKFLRLNLTKLNTPLVVSGFSGIGKTEIVRKYLTMSNYYDIVWILDADYSYKDQFRLLANKINILESNNILDTNSKEIEFNIINFLNTSNYKILFVFENVNSLTVTKATRDIVKYLNNFDTIIISQHSDWKYPIRNIDSLTLDESIKLVNKILKNSKEEETAIIATYCSGVPIILEQISHFFLNNIYLSIKSYIQDLEKQNIKDFTLFADKIEKNYLKNFDIDILRRISCLGNIIDYNLIIDVIMRDRQMSSQNIKEAIASLIKYNLIKSRIEEKNMIEIHDLIRKNSVKKIKNLEIESLIKNINSIFPDNLMDADVLKKKYKDLDHSIEALVALGEEREVNFKLLVELRKNQLIWSMLEYNYLKASEIIGWFENKTQKIKEQITNGDKEFSSLFAWYLLHNGVYEDFYNSDYKSAIKNFRLGLYYTNNDEISLIFSLLSQIVQSQIYAGDLDSSEKGLKEIELKILPKAKEQSIKLDLGLYYFLKAKIALEKGEYDNALLEIKNVRDYESELDDDEFTIPTTILEAEIYTRKGDVKTSLMITKELTKKISKQHIVDHEQKSRSYTWFALANILSEKFEEAAKAISMSESSLIKMGKRNIHGLERSIDDDIADLIQVKGDYEYAKDNYVIALKYYLQANKIYENRFGVCSKVSKIGELYLKICRTAIHLNDNESFYYYMKKHIDIFGITNNRSKEIIKLYLEKSD